jgi:hypothetical protein
MTVPDELKFKILPKQKILNAKRREKYANKVILVVWFFVCFFIIVAMVGLFVPVQLSENPTCLVKT